MLGRPGRRSTLTPAMLLTAVTLTFLATPPTPAAATAFTAVSIFPIDLVVSVPCAAGGAGELVVLSGNLHDLFHITLDASGGAHVSVEDNAQGVAGVGQTTGAKYRAVGVTRDHFNITVGAEETFVNNFRVIGQGSGNNFLVHENFHVTVNANGTVTSLHDNVSVECR